MGDAGTAEIATSRLLDAIGAGCKYSDMASRLGLNGSHLRALDRALDAAKTAGLIRFDRKRLLWVKVEAGNG